MRVGLFTESYDPVINGVSTSVKTLAAELLRAGDQPVIVAPRFPGFSDQPSAGTAEVRRLPSWRSVFNPQNPFAFPPLGNRAPVVLRGTRFDIVHTQQPFGMGLHGRAAARRDSAPLISTFHTLYAEYTHYFPLIPKAAARRWLGGFMRRYYETCDTVIVPSRDAGRYLESIGVPPERLRVVPTGVAPAAEVTPEAVAAARARFSLPADAPLLLYVGRIAREKSMDLMVDAFADILRTGDLRPRPILLLAGSGPYRETLETRVRAIGLEGDVRFAGFLPRADLPPLYAAATVFCFPSATDTQGVVLSEAQGYGLPCVAVNGGGAPEFVRAGLDALVTPPSDVPAFAAALHTLLTDDALRLRFAVAARESPLHPTPEQMARRVLAIYDEALAARRQAS